VLTGPNVPADPLHAAGHSKLALLNLVLSALAACQPAITPRVARDGQPLSEQLLHASMKDAMKAICREVDPHTTIRERKAFGEGFSIC
jgi:hypothetical protein